MRKKNWKRLREGWRRMLPCLMSSWRRTIIALLKHWECKNTEGTTCVLFHSGHRDLLLDLPAGFWLNILSFSELQFWWHFFPTHPMKERKENNIQGTPSLQSWSGGSKEAAGGSTTPTLLPRPFTGGWGLYPTPHSPLSEANGALWPITGIIFRAANDAQPD